MSQQREYRNSGMIYKNEDKQQEKHADYKGHYTDEDGVEFWVSGWIKEGKKGKFISFTLNRKDKQQSNRKQENRYNDDGPDDDIPF